MSIAAQIPLHQRLARQGLGRPLTPSEEALARALESIFAAGEHDFAAAAAALEAKGVVRPSGSPGTWSPAALQDELRRINDDLDGAYAAGASIYD